MNYVPGNVPTNGFKNFLSMNASWNIHRGEISRTYIDILYSNEKNLSISFELFVLFW